MIFDLGNFEAKNSAEKMLIKYNHITLITCVLRDLKTSAKFMSDFKMKAAKLGGPNPFADRNRYHLLKKELARLIPSENCSCKKCVNSLWCP